MHGRTKSYRDGAGGKRGYRAATGVLLAELTGPGDGNPAHTRRCTAVIGDRHPERPGGAQRLGPQPQRGGCIVTVDTTGALKFTNKLAPVPTPKCAAVPKLEPILNGQRAITGDTALRLSNFFGTSGEFWLVGSGNSEPFFPDILSRSVLSGKGPPI